MCILALLLSLTEMLGEVVEAFCRIIPFKLQLYAQADFELLTNTTKMAAKPHVFFRPLHIQS